MKEPKLYICESCGREVRVRSKGLCPLCRSKELPPKKKSPIIKQTAKNISTKKYKREALEVFFEYHINRIVNTKATCIECGIRLMGSNHEVAHILPKRRYTSVMSNLDNAVYLCSMFGNGCHNKWDSNENNADELMKMKCVEKVLNQYLKFKDKVLESGKTLDTLKLIENKFGEMPF